ncbi:MAG: hypothetical protein Greene101449_1414, partial [Candidatus Peregrinibacteria bacterium Greene1014_49]
MIGAPRSPLEDYDIPKEILGSHVGSLIKRYRDKIRLLSHEAKLNRAPTSVRTQDGTKVFFGWHNVTGHLIGEGLAMEFLGSKAGVAPDQIERQTSFALIHDARKHVEKAGENKEAGKDIRALLGPELENLHTEDADRREELLLRLPQEEFTAQEEAALQTKLEALYSAVDPDKSLRTATCPEFMVQLVKGMDPVLFQPEHASALTVALRTTIMQTPLKQILQYYIDAIFLDHVIVSPEVRIAKTKPRNPNPPTSEPLPVPYWDTETLVLPLIETRICDELQQKGTIVPPGNLHDFIRHGVEQDAVMHWLSSQNEANNIQEKREKGSTLHVETLCDTRRAAPILNEDTGIVCERGNIVIAGIFDGATGV